MPRPFRALLGLLAFSFFVGVPALTVSGCGGRIILGLPDSGEPVTPVTCAGDSDCAGSQVGSCQAGECTTPASGSSSGGNGNGNGATGGPFPICPGDKPTSGASCPTQNQGCAYVDLKAGTCESWTCSASYEWESSTPAGC
jgi:hypothetical protein